MLKEKKKEKSKFQTRFPHITCFTIGDKKTEIVKYKLLLYPLGFALLKVRTTFPPFLPLCPFGPLTTYFPGCASKYRLSIQATG